MKVWGLMVLTSLSFAACKVSGQEKDCVVDVKELKADDKKEFVVIDVRTPEEFNSGHLPGAKLINVNGNNFSGEIDKLDKSQQYYVYCRSGKRSAKAQEIMLEKGFKKVCNIEGGILRMQSENIELIKEED